MSIVSGKTVVLGIKIKLRVYPAVRSNARDLSSVDQCKQKLLNIKKCKKQTIPSAVGVVGPGPKPGPLHDHSSDQSANEEIKADNGGE